MKHRGVFKPVLMLAEEIARAAARRTRAIWRQRRIECDRGSRLASDVDCPGEGRILVGAGAQVQRGVILRAEAGAVIEIGEGAVVGEYACLEALAGQSLKLGARCRVGARSSIRSVAGVELGEGCVLGKDAQVGPREPGCNGRLLLGRRVLLQHGCILDLCADIVIGDDVRSGPLCAWYTHNHIPMADGLIWRQAVRCLPIRIGATVWIGQNCVFLPGVEIGGNAVIAAGAVVTKPVGSCVVAGGVPARQIGQVGSKVIVEA